jgi:hypothetical protein
VSKDENKQVSSLYYTFCQNNSGGVFDIDDKVCEYVIIQALSVNDANHQAEQLGIYS